MQETVPTTAVEAATLALLVPCGQCWAPPGVPCTVSGPSGQHLARFQRAERKGLLDRQALAGVIARLDVIHPSVIVPDDPAPIPVIPAARIGAEVAADWHRLTHPARLDGCTCRAVAGSHASGCPWSAR